MAAVIARALAGVVVAATVLGSSGAASAAPEDGGTTTATEAGASRPVHVALSRLEPRTVTPGSVVQVGGTLVNDSGTTYRDLSVRLQRGHLLATRRALDADLDAPDSATDAATDFQPVAGELDPGDSLAFTYSVSADELQLDADGVYPLLVNVNGSSSGGQVERVGELSTYVVAQPAAPVNRTTVAWLWPITDRPHRDASGAFIDDDLAGEVAHDGRLDRAVRAIEDLPQMAGATPDATRPAVPVTLAVDPALLEELSTMAAGRYTVDGRAGNGSTDAADLLDRLSALAAELPVVALPYADVDVDSLVAAGLSDVVTRSLPGTAAGTARESSADGPTDDTGAGAAVIHSVLGVTPQTDVAWPAAGPLRTAALDTLQAGGAHSVVLGEDAVNGAGQLTGVDGHPATARTEIGAAAGPLAAVVADGRLAETVAGAAQTEDARLSEQRYLAELGVLTTQLATDAPGTAQTVLVVPPRELDADPAWASAMIGDTATQPWLQPASLADLTGGPQGGDVTLAAPDADRGLLPTAGLQRLVQAEGVRDAVAGAVVGTAGTTLARYDAGVARAGSVAWREDTAGFATATTDLVKKLGRLRARVTLLAPADGTYSLASSDAPLVLTVRNDLPFAVDVRLDLHARDNVGLTTEDIGVTRLEPQSRTTLQVRAHVSQSGGFAVTAQLRTPDGAALGDPVQMQVKSTAYGRITVLVTLGAALLLALLFLRRLVRFVLRRRRGEPPADEAEPVTLPPTRSPV